MKRRHFVNGLTGLLLVGMVSAAWSAWRYEPGMIEKELAAGKTVLVDYYADWCSVCATQKRVIARLRTENPAYDDKIMFIKVDWDEFATQEVATSRNIPRRSTLILLRGDQELGRVVGGTGKEELKALLDKAL